MRPPLLSLLLLGGCAGQCQAVGGGHVGGGSIGGGGAAPGAAAAGSCDVETDIGTLEHHWAARLESSCVGTAATDQAGSADMTATGTPTCGSSSSLGELTWNFDGTETLSTGAFTNIPQPWSLCVVVNKASDDDGRMGDTDAAFPFLRLNTSQRVTISAGAGATSAADATVADTWHVICAEFNNFGTASNATVDGVEVIAAGTNIGSAGVDDYSMATVNAAFGLAGSVAEVMIYSTTVDDAALVAELESSDCYGVDFPVSGAP